MERINLTKEERLWCRQEAQRVLEAAEAEDLATEGDFLPGPTEARIMMITFIRFMNCKELDENKK